MSDDGTCIHGHGSESIRVDAHGVMRCARCRALRSSRARKARSQRARGAAIVYATTNAVAEAMRLMPGAIVENSVARALAAGRFQRLPNNGLRVDLDCGVVAYAAPRESLLTQRPAWMVTKLRRPA